MKGLLTVVLVVLGVSLSGFAQATTAPSNQPNQSAVMIFPFRQLGDNTSHAWVGEAIQEDLGATASRDPAVKVLPYDHVLGAPPADAAIAGARKAQANLVVFGSFQVVNDQLRVNGQVVNCDVNKTVNVLTATGNIQDFFKLEDMLDAQLRQGLPRPAPPAFGTITDNYYAPPANLQPQGVYPYYNNGPDLDQPQPTQTYAYGDNYAYPGSTYYFPDDDYVYPYAYDTYPYYGGYPYLYGGFYGGVGIYNHGYNHYGNGFRGTGGIPRTGGGGGFHSAPAFAGGGFRGGSFGGGGGFHGGGGGGRR